jgi:hypothetical protein
LITATAAVIDEFAKAIRETHGENRTSPPPGPHIKSHSPKMSIEQRAGVPYEIVSSEAEL